MVIAGGAGGDIEGGASSKSERLSRHCNAAGKDHLHGAVP